jgi:type IV pilus assembly protein PilN
MIRINLLGIERQKPRKAAISFNIGGQVSLICGVVLVATAVGIGWWYWSLTTESQRLDAEITTAQQEAARLRTVLAEVQRFEATRAQLKQRVALIEELRRGQAVPVRLLDLVSRSLPDSLWLTSMDEATGSVTIEGLSTTLIAVSDFVGALGQSALLKKPIDIVNTEVIQSAQTPAGGQPVPDVIKFSVRAQMADTTAPTPTPVKAAVQPPR